MCLWVETNFPLNIQVTLGLSLPTPQADWNLCGTKILQQETHSDLQLHVSKCVFYHMCKNILYKHTHTFSHETEGRL